ncbi:MAG: acyl-CoA dehydrogenase [bacterium]|nr:acyl-CoA dehydrogenase [bacterium]
METNYQKKILEEFSEFVEQKIRPNAKSFDVNETIPIEIIKEMGQKGYLGASISKEYGGLGLDQLHYGFFTEIVGKVCASTRSLLTVHTSLVGETIERVGDKKLKNKWMPLIAKGEKIGAFALTEPNIGSDAKNIKCSYLKNDKSFILNGTKKWITFGHIADFFIVIASDNGVVTAFLVERRFDGVSTKPIKGLLASRASEIAEIELKNVEVPGENVIGRIGGGFNYVVSASLDNGRYSIAWAGLAIAQGALEAMVSYSRSRIQFDQKIYNYQLIKGIIADATTNIHAGRCICEEAGRMRMNLDQKAMMQTNIAKYFTSKIAPEITKDAVQVHGANGCINKFPVERLYRESKILEIIEGSSQIQQEIISLFALRNYYSPDYEKNYILND